METDSTGLGGRLEAALGGAYTLERELGGGGMSRVFLAEDARLGRRVVVKVLAPELAAGLSAERPDDVRFLVHTALTAARGGRRAEAERVAARLAALRRPFDRGQTAYARAQLAAALGDTPAALSLLGQALREGVSYGIALHADPELAPLRADSGSQALLAPKG